MKNSRKSDSVKKFAEAALKDGEQENWETGKLGKSGKHAKRGEPLQSKGTFPTSIRLTRTLVESLRALAEEQGLTYQAYLKMILTKHVRDKNRKKAG